MPIIRHNTREGIDAAIKLPKTITTDDGRELKITRWMPVVDINDLTKVTVEAIISLPESYWETQPKQ